MHLIAYMCCSAFKLHVTVTFETTLLNSVFIRISMSTLERTLTPARNDARKKTKRASKKKVGE